MRKCKRLKAERDALLLELEGDDFHKGLRRELAFIYEVAGYWKEGYDDARKKLAAADEFGTWQLDELVKAYADIEQSPDHFFHVAQDIAERHARRER